MNVFIDTNVLLDVLGKREPFYGDSATIWTLAETGTIRGLVSALSFPNVYYILRRLATRRTAFKAVRLMRKTFVPVELDGATLDQAIDLGLEDFEDAIQFCTALRSGAACLVTRNAQHFPSQDIPILTPAEFLTTYFAE